jgi:5'-deoxynucleotidase YfbR-like HD superfamily hydrolase
MFGFSSFAALPFASIQKYLSNVTPIVWGATGGLGKKKKEKVRQSARAELKEYLATVFDEPIAAELKEEVAEYVKPSQGFSIDSIDYGKLAKNVELVQNIIAKFQEIQQEQEDEALLLMLM